MTLSVNFSDRLTAATAHVPASDGLTAVVNGIATLATTIAANLPASASAPTLELAVEDRLIDFVSWLACEFK